MIPHRDLVHLEWATSEAVLVDRLPADAVELAGDYAFVSTPHRAEDCPFRRARALPLSEYGVSQVPRP